MILIMLSAFASTEGWFIAFFLSAALFLQGQTATPSASQKNLIPNGSFEEVTPSTNLYDGVDSIGNLQVQTIRAPVYTEKNDAKFISFSASPCLVDVNGDELPDLVVSSSLGFLYWYPNTGAKGKPSFKAGRLIQTYLGPAARIDVADWDSDGKKDILFGNIDGGVYLLLNQGTAQEPRWAQGNAKPRWFPPSLPPPAREYDVQLGYEVSKVFNGSNPMNIGNYSAPVLVDWNKDGLLDLIVGEGTYSANSVYVWLNTGNKTKPVFKPESRFYLASGEGREQLAPTVYDWNGDGILDLVVGDRNGRIALYLGTAEAIKNPQKIEPLPFTKFITLDSRGLDTAISVYACDYNNDGIPDLIYGTSTGSIEVALGKGKRDSPELDKSFSIKGVDTAKDFKEPTSWRNEYLFSAIKQGTPYTGTAPLAQAISKDNDSTLEPKDGKRVFYLSWFEKFCGWHFLHHRMTEGSSDIALPTGFSESFVEGCYILNNQFSFTLGKKYELTFWSKGKGMNILCFIDYREGISNPKAPKNPPIYIRHHYADAVALSSNWIQYRKTYRLDGAKELNIDTNGKIFNGAWLSFFFVGSGDAWVDDVRLVEVD